jgi:AcrR family transcriptional regulator
MARPAYRRLKVEDRREQLLERGAELFTRYSYDELSMRKIAREAGISKALLYHYFPSKQAFFQATLAQAAEQLRAQTEPDPELPPLEQLRGSLEAFLKLIDENDRAYVKCRGQVADGGPDPGGPLPGRGAAEGAGRRARMALVHGRRLPQLDRASRPLPRRGPRPAAGHPVRSFDRGRRGTSLGRDRRVIDTRRMLDR